MLNALVRSRLALPVSLLCFGGIAPRVQAAATATVAAVETPRYQLGFGPYVGGGQISGGATVRNASGYVVSIDRPWSIGGGLALGPRFELSNSFINTKAVDGGTKTLGTYDNRVIAGGITLRQESDSGSAQARGLYGTAVIGRGFSKLAVDENGDRSSRQNLYSNITGSYFGSEVGVWIPLKGNFGVDVAVLGSYYRADQSGATGTYEGSQIGDGGGLSLSEGRHPAGEGSLSAQVGIRTVAAKVGLSLGF